MSSCKVKVNRHNLTHRSGIHNIQTVTEISNPTEHDRSSIHKHIQIVADEEVGKSPIRHSAPIL